MTAPTRTCECGKDYVDDPGGRQVHKILHPDHAPRPVDKRKEE